MRIGFNDHSMDGDCGCSSPLRLLQLLIDLDHAVIVDVRLRPPRQRVRQSRLDGWRHLKPEGHH
jgi:hypothetical protein